MARYIPLTILLLALLPSSTAIAKTWNVPSEITTIQAAIDTAATGDSIIVAAGTFHERLSIVGKSISLLSIAGSANTIISGETFPPDGNPLLYLEDCDSTTVISGFTFEKNTNCVTSGGALECQGFFSLCAPRISDNVFRYNSTTSDGGAIYSTADATPRIENNVFYSNEAFSGGAIYLFSPGTFFGGQLTISNNDFDSNIAIPQGLARGVGGAISVWVGLDTVIISSNRFFDNEADYATINIDSSPVVLENNTIVSNKSNAGESFRPAGIRVRNASPVIRNNIVALSANGWGINVSGNGTPVLICNDFWDNELGDYNGIIPGPNDFSADPRFCSVVSKVWTLASNSPCLPANNNCGNLVGADSVGCGAVLGIPIIGPVQPSLTPNYPNPFAAQTNLSFQIPSPGHVTLSIFDLAGREVARLMDGELPAGEHEALWNGRDQLGRALPDGVYLMRLETGEGVKSRKIVKVD